MPGSERGRAGGVGTGLVTLAETKNGWLRLGVGAVGEDEMNFNNRFVSHKFDRKVPFSRRGHFASIHDPETANKAVCGLIAFASMRATWRGVTCKRCLAKRSG